MVATIPPPNITLPDRTRPDQTTHTPGNPSRCDHIPQSLLTTTSHTTTGCGTARKNHPTVQTTRPMSTPQPEPHHRPTRPHQTRPDQTTPGNSSRCDYTSQSVLTTTSHTTTGCGTAGRNHPTVQTTRPMSPPQPESHHRPTRPQLDQTRPRTPGNPSRCDHIPQSVLTTTSHTTTGCGTAGRNHPTVQTTRPIPPA